MMRTGLEYEHAMMHYMERLQEVREKRMARSANLQGVGWGHQVAIWLGDILIRVGTKLKGRCAFPQDQRYHPDWQGT